MYNRFKNLKEKEKGQGLVEYALILVLVAIVVIAALMALGPRAVGLFASIEHYVAGATGQCQVAGALADDYTAEQIAMITSMPVYQQSAEFFSSRCH